MVDALLLVNTVLQIVFYRECIVYISLYYLYICMFFYG